MNFNSRDCLLAWAAGLFEGEGCIRSKHSLSVIIEMTDLDVLESFQKNFGGSLIKQRLRKSYKQTWKWSLHGEKALSFIKDILPFLHSRRLLKAQSAIIWYERLLEKQRIKDIKVTNFRLEVFKLRKTGLTHKEISIKLNVDRSYITHILNNKYGDVRELVNPAGCGPAKDECKTRTSPQL